MALQRKTDPLPPGRYWVDVFPPNVGKLATYFKAFSGLGMHVETTEQGDGGRVFYIFSWKPTFDGSVAVWDAKTFGYPTIADPQVKSASDTVQRPDLPMDAVDKLADTVSAPHWWLMPALGAAGALLIVIIVPRVAKSFLGVR